jgi:hypothetical protein
LKISKFKKFKKWARLAMGWVDHRMMWLSVELAIVCAGRGRG